MSSPQVITINLTKPITVIGKMFHGDYAKSYQYVTEVKDTLAKSSVHFIQNKVMGVYYDNPSEKKPEELKSFQAVFVRDPNSVIPDSLEKLQLIGNYIYVKITGDIMKAIHEGYGALFKYIAENRINLKSAAGYQVTTLENEEITTEIYMEIL